MNNSQSNLLIPGLRPFYDWAEPISWLLVRLTAGLMIIPHGWPKVVAGIGPTAASALARRRIEPAEPLAVILILLETVGGLCVALGLFTRFFAAAIAIEMAVIAYQYFPKFGWTLPGYEYPLMWCLVMLAITLRAAARTRSIARWAANSDVTAYGGRILSVSHCVPGPPLPAVPQRGPPRVYCPFVAPSVCAAACSAA